MKNALACSHLEAHNIFMYIKMFKLYLIWPLTLKETDFLKRLHLLDSLYEFVFFPADAMVDSLLTVNPKDSSIL